MISSVTKEEILAYVESALQHDTTKPSRPLILGSISAALAERIKAESGIDLQSALIRLTVTYIKHAFIEHGTSREYKRGQIPIEVTDFADIPTIISQHEQVQIDQKRSKQIIRFSLRLEMLHTLVFECLLQTSKAANYRIVLDFNTYYKKA